LIQATLVAGDDAPKAIALLDTARLLEPGTLIEEAALRKEMSLIGASGDLDKFTLLSRRYLGGFSHSTYADNFRSLVAQAAMRLGAGNSDEAARKLAKLLGGLDKVERRRLYLAIARQALLAGRMEMAASAGAEAGRLAGRDEPDAARAQVYIGAAQIVGTKYEAGVAALGAVAPDRLDASDRALRLSAMTVADVIRKPPSVNDGGVERGEAAADLLAAAERSLTATDSILRAPQ
jgi:chemotaxis protein MotC